MAKKLGLDLLFELPQGSLEVGSPRSSLSMMIKKEEHCDTSFIFMLNIIYDDI